MLTTADFIIIATFACLILLYKLVLDWYGIREQPRRIDLKAADFLREEGYRIQARAAVKYIDFDIDGNSHRQKVKADLIARQGLKKYVVEVNAKDGGSVRNADIRRRLLEYQIAFSPNGILTVDMDKKKIRMITVSNRRWLVSLLALASALALGAVIYLLVR
jgi:RNase P/RNase MRP subunit POP5